MDILSAASLGVGVLLILFSVFVFLGYVGRVGTVISVKKKDINTFKKIGWIGIVFIIILFGIVFWVDTSTQLEIARINAGAVLPPEEVVLPPEFVFIEVTPVVNESQTLTSTPKDTAQITQTLTQTSSPTPTYTPILTSIPTFDIGQPSGSLDVAGFVAVYYDRINSASNWKDLQWGWNRLSYNLQSISNHDIKTYASEWLSLRVKYQVWECSETEVDVFLRYFGKADINFQDEYSNLWISYLLGIDENNEWIIKSGTAFSIRINPESKCKLEVSN